MRYVEEDACRREAIHGDLSFQRWLRAQRTAPRLVSAKRAAEMMGIKPPHISRLREQGRMPDPIPVEGGNDAYVFEEVKALAGELNRERAARARRKEERDDARVG